MTSSCCKERYSAFCQGGKGQLQNWNPEKCNEKIITYNHRIPTTNTKNEATNGIFEWNNSVILTPISCLNIRTVDVLTVPDICLLCRFLCPAGIFDIFPKTPCKKICLINIHHEVTYFHMCLCMIININSANCYSMKIWRKYFSQHLISNYS